MGIHFLKNISAYRLVNPSGRLVGRAVGYIREKSDTHLQVSLNINIPL